jgi:hypothetical protein
MAISSDRDTGLTAVVEDLKERFKNFPAVVEASAERPEMFWQRQRAAIRSRIAIDEASRRPWAGFAWATALSLLVLAGLAVHSAPPLPQATPEVDPDQQLLISVEQAIHSGVPEALEPAAMLADDISQVVEPVSMTHPSGKEKQSEN